MISSGERAAYTVVNSMYNDLSKRIVDAASSGDKEKLSKLSNWSAIEYLKALSGELEKYK